MPFLGLEAHRWVFLVCLTSCTISYMNMRGLLDWPLPYPAVNTYIQSPPEADAAVEPQAMEGPFAPNELLKGATKLFAGQLQGAETVCIAPDGSLLLPDVFGHVWTAEAPSAASPSYRLSETPIVKLGQGRPLGSLLDADGNLIVCDALKGLLKVDKDTRAITLLAGVVSDDSPLQPDSRIHFTNSLDIAKDGRIFFTTSQEILPALGKDGFWDCYGSWVIGVMSGHGKGRLLVHYPATGKTHVLATGFYFANGVTLSPDESFVLVSETTHRRVWRFWLQGPKAGTKEVFVDALPGFPDGISRASDGNYWLTLVTQYPTDPNVKYLERFQILRSIFAYLPASLQPQLKPWGCVVKLSPDGEVLSTMQDPDGSHIAYVTAAHEHNGRLFLGNVAQDYISYINV